MSIKKKLGMGIATLSLGAVMALGGTFAAFNDVETVSNSFAAGTLDLDIVNVQGYSKEFGISNVKPGDSMTRRFKLVNSGTLAIKEVWLDVTASNFANGNNEFVDTHGMLDNDLDLSGLEFLDQFKIEVLRTGLEADPDSHVQIPPFYIIKASDNLTLRDLVEGTNIPAGVELDGSGRINLAPKHFSEAQWDGMPVVPSDYEIIEVKLSMINNTTDIVSSGPAAGEYEQNKFQGDFINLLFSMEATQWQGIHGKTNDYHNAENKTANPSDEP